MRAIEIKDKLKESKEFCESIYENYLPIFVMYTEDGQIVDANQAACSFYKYTKEEFTKLKITDLNVLPCEDVFKHIEDAKMKKKSHFFFPHKLSTGEIRNVEVYSGCINIDGKKFLYSIVKDITQSEINKKKLILFEKVFENSTEGILITDINGYIKWINSSFSLITGYSKDELIGKNVNDFYINMWSDLRKEGKWRGEIVNTKKNGEITVSLVNFFSVNYEKDNITHFAGIITDITENKLKEEKINYLAFRDCLTGLYNRSYFMETLDIEINKAKKNNKMLAVLFMDLDGFKKINDSLGHCVGDKLLKEVALRLKKCVRKNDIISRLGGDEFTLLIKDIVNIENVALAVQRIMSIFKNPYLIGEYKIYISASIGISIYPNDGVESGILIRNADIAMYNAKDSGKNKFKFYCSNLNDKIQEEFILENNLRYALDKNEFFINYQPIFDVNTEKIVGMEALLRWKHIKLGIIPPSKFIPIAESSGLITKIGNWVLKNACIHAKKFHDLGIDVFISVNVSVNQLKEGNFARSILKIIKETGIDPKYLDLEITESISMENIDYIRDVLNKIKDLKVNISMDDFGTGYSSLAQLKNLCISKLKIDSSFIKDIYIDSNSTAIVSAIIAMAKNLNIEVIAEGVETKDQFEFLKEHGCEMVQGYLFSPPVDENSIRKLIENQY
ncbi:sensor domain-containing protein [Tepidibacter thalassicus]|uniref:PAS domain S-box-containing protein/diguanylate cyclase (GGDEF) domain-containing protein n=1 Tax=Tepidibacter thalassicus DSM 15285 TaxID=1123350 RepID=A0A1M5QR81_9FIRM|nr:bifunctional diguanylate cyclase/phosphodiesterase [Tepidibacter thalassicus]SHH16597.1 PAS domain S-box-containing protein/diguanylate cyclase (GGDEF) domain-containing protein [Tepidibacter thalassicus DSM 15285]